MMYSSLEATGSIMNKKMSGHVQPAQELESTKIIDIKLKEKRKRSDEDSGPITWDGDMPQKRFYRQRAHCNPLSFNDSFEQLSVRKMTFAILIMTLKILHLLLFNQQSKSRRCVLGRTIP